MNHIILTSFIPCENDVIDKSKGKPISFANSTFQKALIRGMSNIKGGDDNISIINVANIGCYPFNYNSPYYKSDLNYIYDIPTDNMSFINVSYIKHLNIYKKLVSQLKEMLSPEEETTITCYDLYWPFIKACSTLKQTHSIKLVVIVPDIPDLTGTPDSALYKLYFSLPQNNVYDYLHDIDGYILLTESMKHILNIGTTPYMIMEGIFDRSNVTNIGWTGITLDKDKFNILYTGALSTRNGLEKLVESVIEIKDMPMDICLNICGAGELSRYMEEKSANNPRIKYWGQLPRDKVIDMQHQASLLINPRNQDEEFAKYSFPSKTMEYMASGTPVLMYRLKTLPAEYEPYLFFIDSEHKDGLKYSIERIMKMSMSERQKLGSSAKDFILKEKNETAQAKRVFHFINNI